MKLIFTAVTRREYIPVGSAPASDRQGWRECRKCRSIFRPAGEGHRTEHQSHSLEQTVAIVPLFTFSCLLCRETFWRDLSSELPCVSPRSYKVTSNSG